MKGLLKRFNWRNFLQRTILFLAVFIIIRLLVDWLEGDVSLLRVFRLSLVRYLAFAMVLGLLDSENWSSNKETKEEEKVLEFASLSAAFFHYTGVAFFISLLCGFIFFLFFLFQWLVNYFTGKPNATLFPNWLLYLLVIVAIGISFAAFDAYRNHRRKKRK
jgi:hypothetical protein